MPQPTIIEPATVGNVYACKGGQKTDYWIVIRATDTAINCVGVDKEGRITSTANYQPHVFNKLYVGFGRPIIGRCEWVVGIRLKITLASVFIAEQAINKIAKSKKENAMTLEQGIELGILAKAKGYGLRVLNGQVQAITVTYHGKGESVTVPRSNYMTYEEAKAFLGEDEEKQG